MTPTSPTKPSGGALVRYRHPEWVENQVRWRFLADSLESGDRYRFADYSVDPTDPLPTSPAWYETPVGSVNDVNLSQLTYAHLVKRNLIPHHRELTTEGRDLYLLRLARTPTPRILGRTVDAHLTKVYQSKISRTGPAALEAWWKDCDGRGSDFGCWMEEAVAPLLMALGQLDLQFDHPAAPAGAVIETRADAERLGLAGCVATVVLPEHMVWWRLDSNRARYVEALVYEPRPGCAPVYRHWTADRSDCYSAAGVHLPDRSFAHRFGRVPIVRVFDRRRVRCDHVGMGRYEGVAELMRAVYNSRSELVLSDVQQSHAQLMAPAEYCGTGSEIPIGPDGVLPMRPLVNGANQVVGYQGMAWLDPPKGAQEAIRVHIQDYQDEARDEGSLLKPAGMTTSSTVGQSGISKQADQQDGNAVLARVAEVLEHCELVASRMALVVLGDGGPGDPEGVLVEYPKQFDLSTAGDTAAALDAVQRAASAAGALPKTEAELLKRLATQALPSLSDEDLAGIHAEIDAHLKDAAAAWHEPPPVVDPNAPVDPNANTNPAEGGVSPGATNGHQPPTY